MNGEVEFLREGARLRVLLPWSSGLGVAVTAPVPPMPLPFTPNRDQTPSRITVALDASGLWGPEVDEALGVVDPTVDLWESGDLVPTPEDIGRLATLTGMPTAFFYLDPVPEFEGGWICGRGKPFRGCQPLGGSR